MPECQAQIPQIADARTIPRHEANGQHSFSSQRRQPIKRESAIGRRFGAAPQAAAAEAAHAHIAALEKQLDEARELGETKLDALRATQELEVGALRAATAMRDQSFQTELDKATRRMEGDEKRMMKQISEARADQNRAEALVMKMQQTNESSLNEMSASMHFPSAVS